MSKSATGLRDAVIVPDQPAPTPEEIRQQLAKILVSPSFHGSKRCQQFLEYVCDKSLSGEGGTLKERTIAIEVFGRQPQSDLGEDTIVRVGAREVRKRLTQYYVTPGGASCDVRIELPLGSYAPEFRYVVPPHEEETPAAVASPMPVEKAPRIRNRRLWIYGSVAAAVAAVAILAGVRLTRASPNAEAFQRFWDPILQSEEPLLVAVAHPLVYHASGRAIKLSEENLTPQEIPLQRPIQVPPKKLDGSDLVPVLNQYVGFGDMVVASEISAMMAKKDKSVRLRLASGIEFADMRRAPILLIGAVTNRWTMQLQQAWRFRFSWTPGTRTVISDTQNPSASHWSIPQRDDGSAPEDYILICRIRHSITGGILLAGAGLKQFGTEAAGRLLTDPEQLGTILRKLPHGWETKNLQVVLHAKVINNTAAQPDVVASHVW
jgi:hypothetical protein